MHARNPTSMLNMALLSITLTVAVAHVDSSTVRTPWKKPTQLKGLPCDPLLDAHGVSCTGPLAIHSSREPFCSIFPKADWEGV